MAIFRRVVLLLHLLLAPCLVHCAGEPTPKRPEPHARRPSREPRLPASAPPPAPSAPAAPAAEEPASAGAAASSRFVPQVRLEAGITGLHVAGRQLLVAQGTKLALWTNGELDVADEHSKNLPEPGRVQAIVGDWPNVRALAWWAHFWPRSG